jgi:sec-independent protein translocase protein TatA
MIDVYSTQVVYAIGIPGGSELLIILAIVLVLFGGSKIPQLGDALGKGIQNFRRSFQKEEEGEAEVLEAEVVNQPTDSVQNAETQIEDQSSSSN